MPGTAVKHRRQQKSSSTPTHEPTMCVQQYNSSTRTYSSTAEKHTNATQTAGFELTYSRKKSKKKNKKSETGGFVLTLCLPRIEGSTAEPKGNVVITCHFRKGNLQELSFAEFGCDARSFGWDRKGCCVGGTWRGPPVSGDRVVLETHSCFWGIS